jgi:hypothetical protein
MNVCTTYSQIIARRYIGVVDPVDGSLTAPLALHAGRAIKVLSAAPIGLAEKVTPEAISEVNTVQIPNCGTTLGTVVDSGTKCVKNCGSPPISEDVIVNGT